MVFAAGVPTQVMTAGSKRAQALAGAAFSLAGVLMVVAVMASSQRGKAASEGESTHALIGEARPGAVTVDLAPAIGEVKLTEAGGPDARSCSSTQAMEGTTPALSGSPERSPKRT